MLFRRYPCGGWFARGTKPQFQRTDQGEDRSVTRGVYVRAPGDGYVVSHLSDAPFPGGFGSPYAVVKITSGRFAAGDGLWYVGHANSNVLPVGRRFRFGDKLARTDNGFYPNQGWVEIGKCVGGLPGLGTSGARYHRLFRSVWRRKRR
jgi:hypothetical protein